jgi:hypothetical protein
MTFQLYIKLIFPDANFEIVEINVNLLTGSFYGKACCFMHQGNWMSTRMSSLSSVYFEFFPIRVTYYIVSF